MTELLQQIIYYCSRAPIVMYMGGAVATIALKQLKLLFGIKNFAKKPNIVYVMRSVISIVHHELSRLFVSSYL